MVSLARKNLLNDIPRFLVAQAGIMFAVSLVTLQTGIFNGFTRSTGQLIYNSDADIWVSSDTLVQLEMTLPIPASYVLDARKIEGVKIAEPLIFSGALWRPPQGEITRARIIGFDIKGQLFTPVNISEGSVDELKKPYTLIVDKKNQDSLSIKKIGDKIQVNSFPSQVVGFTEGNKSIVSNAFTFMSLETANTILTSGQTSSLSCQLPSKSQQFSCTNSYTAPSDLAALTTAPPPPNKLVASDLITYVLIKVKPGEDIEKLKKKLQASLPNTRAYSREELLEKNQTFWQKRTGVGFVLGLGAVVGVIVGIIIVGQILYSSVLDHLKEFGTLKAIGASDWTIYGVIIEQALWMAVFGYIPGMVLCYGVAYWAFVSEGILILITPVSAIAVLGITVGMCVGSAIFAIQKVTRLDPAMVFKA
ncbi:MAG TPA: ABC transporter permease [Cyanobacteria bacterium UBA11149]|nr:ABC transporter permease [Cyanobacteria bacterium UBA11367]HBE56660.1 ABC transporter permease [Cyanobacteria bacterium UBA11366]HBK66360.1 ABC transporter permease [Cyanobacteria bacterium UBA11166]HBR74126.1 ABC transporter permease [Cyanobacteria bacterium UBA11159]HBS71347.1 ABC transporter permease [Cyanobacteria bacterium UBA11153]HBW87628.1 ABC transporter permease [Cyanobacteria bacterium UBA11149]HCA95092.1 ABC transporter permease [Cyanobacteria bacterium UBA9226]